MVSSLYSEFPGGQTLRKVLFFLLAVIFFGGAFKRFKSHGFRCHRLRHENLHNFEKNLDQNGLLRKKLEHFEIGQPKFLRSENFKKNKFQKEMKK